MSQLLARIRSPRCRKSRSATLSIWIKKPWIKPLRHWCRGTLIKWRDPRMWKMQSLKSFTPTLHLSKSKAHDTTPTIGSKLAVLRRQLIQFSLRLRAKSSIIIHLNTKAGQYSRGMSMNQGQCIAMTIGKCRTPNMVLMITITKTKALKTQLLQNTTGRIRNLRVDKISYKQLRIQVISKQD